MVDGQNGSVIHSASQTARHQHNVKTLTGTVTGMRSECVNRLSGTDTETDNETD